MRFYVLHHFLHTTTINHASSTGVMVDAGHVRLYALQHHLHTTTITASVVMADTALAYLLVAVVHFTTGPYDMPST